ncbi:hypothetical protein SANTM175S_09344 [Streptomyces antimycoticus]
MFSSPAFPAAAGAEAPWSSAFWRKVETSVTVGWSKTSMAGRSREVARSSLLRASTADRESKPSSTKGWSSPTEAGSVCPSTAATVPRTSAASSSCRCSAGRAASLRRTSP